MLTRTGRKFENSHGKSGLHGVDVNPGRRRRHGDLHAQLRAIIATGHERAPIEGMELNSIAFRHARTAALVAFCPWLSFPKPHSTKRVTQPSAFASAAAASRRTAARPPTRASRPRWAKTASEKRQERSEEAHWWQFGRIP